MCARILCAQRSPLPRLLTFYFAQPHLVRSSIVFSFSPRRSTTTAYKFLLSTCVRCVHHRYMINRRSACSCSLSHIYSLCAQWMNAFLVHIRCAFRHWFRRVVRGCYIFAFECNIVSAFLFMTIHGDDDIGSHRIRVGVLIRRNANYSDQQQQQHDAHTGKLTHSGECAGNTDTESQRQPQDGLVHRFCNSVNKIIIQSSGVLLVCGVRLDWTHGTLSRVVNRWRPSFADDNFFFVFDLRSLARTHTASYPCWCGTVCRTVRMLSVSNKTLFSALYCCNK